VDVTTAILSITVVGLGFAHALYVYCLEIKEFRSTLADRLVEIRVRAAYYGLWTLVLGLVLGELGQHNQRWDRRGWGCLVFARLRRLSEKAMKSPCLSVGQSSVAFGRMAICISACRSKNYSTSSPIGRFQVMRQTLRPDQISRSISEITAMSLGGRRGFVLALR
jgi:hypothetical protein